MPGQESGQATETVGIDWSSYVDGLVERRGSLRSVAEHLAQSRGFEEDVESVERGLRRLRSRGTLTGGVWGKRVLDVFGLADDVASRIRWMGQYHTRFIDLPGSICSELIRPWDRPPVSESVSYIWVMLARVNLRLRARQPVMPMLDAVRSLAGRAESVAGIEYVLVRSFVLSRTDAEASHELLRGVDQTIEGSQLDAHNRACLFARWIDQVAYRFNRPPAGMTADHQQAQRLYERIPEDGPGFARCRRHNGLGWSKLRQGKRDEAVRHAVLGIEAAGDAGSLRLRAMALNLLAEAEEGEASEVARVRARSIAEYLEDEALRVRFGARCRVPGESET